jgi:hypothetical protein
MKYLKAFLNFIDSLQRANHAAHLARSGDYEAAKQVITQ